MRLTNKFTTKSLTHFFSLSKFGDNLAQNLLPHINKTTLGYSLNITYQQNNPCLNYITLYHYYKPLFEIDILTDK